jgi:hypothetical protein
MAFDSGCKVFIQNWEARKPWERMYIDFMEFRGHKILILDSCLKWIKVWVMSRSDTTAIIDWLENFI